MRRALWIAFAVSCASGCYTVLRHPRVEDPAPAGAAVAFVDDCRACHGPAWDPWLARAACPPPWSAYYREPWWRRATGTAHVQGAGLANDRPPLPVPAFLPPSATTSAPPAPVVAPPARSPATGDADESARPREPERRATPHPPQNSGAPRRGQRSETPRPPAADASANDSTRAAPHEAPQDQGRGLPSDRRSPKP